MIFFSFYKEYVWIGFSVIFKNITAVQKITCTLLGSTEKYQVSMNLFTYSTNYRWLIAKGDLFTQLLRKKTNYTVYSRYTIFESDTFRSTVWPCWDNSAKQNSLDLKLNKILDWYSLGRKHAFDITNITKFYYCSFRLFS